MITPKPEAPVPNFSLNPEQAAAYLRDTFTAVLAGEIVTPMDALEWLDATDWSGRFNVEQGATTTRLQRERLGFIGILGSRTTSMAPELMLEDGSPIQLQLDESLTPLFRITPVKE